MTKMTKKIRAAPWAGLSRQSIRARHAAPFKAPAPRRSGAASLRRHEGCQKGRETLVNPTEPQEGEGPKRPLGPRTHHASVTVPSGARWTPVPSGRSTHSAPLLCRQHPRVGSEGGDTHTHVCDGEGLGWQTRTDRNAMQAAVGHQHVHDHPYRVTKGALCSGRRQATRLVQPSAAWGHTFVAKAACRDAPVTK